MVLQVGLNISPPEEQEDVNNQPEGQNLGSALLHEEQETIMNACSI
jgi:hypothetical protein